MIKITLFYIMSMFYAFRLYPILVGLVKNFFK